LFSFKRKIPVDPGEDKENGNGDKKKVEIGVDNDGEKHGL
jgi:hypothetical protein